MSSLLPEISLLTISEKEEKENKATFVFEPLAPGYGITLGNSLRRILLSSLYGAAITTIKIDGADHEFTTVAGVEEDVVEIILNLKAMPIRLDSNEPVTIKIDKKGPGEVTAGDFSKSADITIVDPTYHIATLAKNGRFKLEAKIEKNRGYVPTENREDEKLPLGSVAIDAIFTPVKKINYEVENTRVGGQTNFDKLTLEITTDGSKTPKEAVIEATQILSDYLGRVLELKSEKKAEKSEKKETAKKETKATSKDKKINEKTKKIKS